MSQPSSKSETSPHPTARPPLDEALGDRLEALRTAGLERFLRVVDGSQDPVVTLEGKRIALFCSNNYLGLASDPRVVAAARSALERYGAGAASSRLISGHMRAHADLEDTIASWKRCERALVFSTGYQANVGVIASLVGRDDVVVSDELNHASIIDGCRLSRARIAVYRHNDVGHLAEQLDLHRDASCALVVTESIFSMDGDRAPLKEIAAVASERGAWLMVDEAHAAGVFGPGGAGLVAEEGLGDAVDVHMGTLGKALGSFGAYVAGSRTLIDLLVNRARSFIFTTALPPSAVAAAQAAIEIVGREPERARGLLARARALGERLRAAGLELPHLDSQILPVMIGGAQQAVAVAAGVLDRGAYVAAIRPPTVPPGTSRLRLSMMATHTQHDIDLVAAALCEAAQTIRSK
jgi:8-amino-7-oxononanoate synthase